VASRYLGIGHGADEWRKRLGAWEGKDYVHELGARAGSRRFTLPRGEVDAFWSAVRALLDAPPPPENSWAAYAEWALDRYRRFLDPDPRIESAIASLSALEGFALEEPREALLDALAGLSEPAGGTGGVRVYDAMAARGSSFRALLVLGMNERVFPRFILEDPFLSDAVRSRLEHRLGCRMSRKVKGHEEERLLYALLMGSADEIVLCHQRSDERGRVQIPSPFLPKGDPRPIPRRPAERLRSEPIERLTPREASLRTGQGEALGRAMGWNVEPLVEATSFLRRIGSRGALTEFDGLVDAREYWNRVAAYGISPTPLERLAECPFRFFAERMLGLEELDEPESEEMLAPLEVGQIYHQVLERFYSRGDLEARLAESFQDFEATRSIRYPVLWEVEKERIASAVRALVRGDDLSFFAPRDFERELKAEIALEVGGRKTVTFRGFVDRLDLGPGNAFRVIDYKKSRGRYSVGMGTGVFKHGRYLQPPIYFLLARHALGEVDLKRSLFAYYFIEEALRGEDWQMELTGEMWSDYPLFEAHLKRILEPIPRGEFTIRPGDHCRNCDSRVLCRKSHLPTRWRSEEHESSR